MIAGALAELSLTERVVCARRVTLAMSAPFSGCCYPVLVIGEAVGPVRLVELAALTAGIAPEIPAALEVPLRPADERPVGRRREARLACLEHQVGLARRDVQPRPLPAAAHRQVQQPRVQALQDRKSTRLNSSHQIISYAVFCLKKKKPCST